MGETMRPNAAQRPYGPGNDLWDDQVRRAFEAWHVVVEDSMDNVRYVEAESNTGSRYAVFVTRLTSVMRDRAGGPLLVTVLWPWQDSWCLQESGVLTAEYVGEKLTCHRYKDRRVNAGDLTALTMTVAYALNRTTFLPSELL